MTSELGGKCFIMQVSRYILYILQRNKRDMYNIKSCITADITRGRYFKSCVIIYIRTSSHGRLACPSLQPITRPQHHLSQRNRKPREKIHVVPIFIVNNQTMLQFTDYVYTNIYQYICLLRHVYMSCVICHADSKRVELSSGVRLPMYL